MLALFGIVATDPGFDPSTLGRDLYCSSCQQFVEAFLMAANTPVFTTKRDKSPRSIYKRRISAIYRQHNPEKLQLVDGMLRHYRDREHSLYQKVCYWYGEAIEPAYTKDDMDSEEEEYAWKSAHAQLAMDQVHDDIRTKETQWAVSGSEPDRKYIDFNKAMSGGNMGTISTSGEYKTQLEEAFAYYAAEHGMLLVSAIARSARLYDSGVHKTFCNRVRACVVEEAVEAQEGEGEHEEHVHRDEDEDEDSREDALHDEL